MTAQGPSNQDRADVLLCSMPFGLLLTPSLALGLLQASLEPLGVSSRQLYPAFDFARRIGLDRYKLIAQRWEVGDWIFAEALFPDTPLDPEGFIEAVLRRPNKEYQPFLESLHPSLATAWIESTVEAAIAGRSAAEPFLEDTCQRIVRLSPRVVGLTCSFQQRLSSLALARKVRQCLPDVTIVLGGPELQGSSGTEILARFPFVDAVVRGPGDVVFADLVQRVMRCQPLQDVPGLLTRGIESSVPSPGPTSLDALPYPRVDDFFSELETSGLPPPPELYLSLETSRGCWWGDHPKRHCTFCGLNGDDLAFLAKSPSRAVEELVHFSRRHPGLPLVMTDAIFPMRYFDDVLPRLAAKPLGVPIQYETRVTLSYEQLQSMAAAGIVQIQPGIESLSTPLLTLMRKRTTMLHGIQLLKWCKELGIHVLWNLLGGFPGEPKEAYAEMAAVIPKLTHLQAPSGFRWINLVRHSPIFEDAEGHGLTKVTAAPAYGYIFPFDEETRTRLATLFQAPELPPEGSAEYAQTTRYAVTRWRQLQGRCELLVMEGAEQDLIVDSRTIAQDRVATVTGLERSALRFCHRIRETARIEEHLSCNSLELCQVLGNLENRNLLVREGEKWLALPVRSQLPG